MYNTCQIGLMNSTHYMTRIQVVRAADVIYYLSYVLEYGSVLNLIKQLSLKKSLTVTCFVWITYPEMRITVRISVWKFNMTIKNKMTCLRYSTPSIFRVTLSVGKNRVYNKYQFHYTLTSEILSDYCLLNYGFLIARSIQAENGGWLLTKLKNFTRFPWYEF